MAVLSAQVRIKMQSGVTADDCVNTFHFIDPDPDDGADNAAAAILDLYGDLQGLFPSDVAQLNHRVKIYDLDDPEPRAPIKEFGMNFASAPTGAPLPHQLAICASFQGDRISGVPQSRRRGRIYVGPLDASSSATDGRPSTTTITTINNAMEAFRDALAATSTDWIVWSPTDGSGAVITNGWCDNRYDIQRRRARLATARNPWS